MPFSETFSPPSLPGSAFHKPQQRQRPPCSKAPHAWSRALGMPVVVQRPLRYPYSLANKQINAPQRIAPALLQPFVERRKHVLLVCPALSTLPALLTAFDEHELKAEVQKTESLLPSMHQLLLVVFPVLPQQSYVLQTRLEARSGTQVTLRYQEPRCEPRRHIPASVTLYLAPPSAMPTMEHHQMHLTRAAVAHGRG